MKHFKGMVVPVNDGAQHALLYKYINITVLKLSDLLEIGFMYLKKHVRLTVFNHKVSTQR